jgi:outer membrane protein assembly factor BamA
MICALPRRTFVPCLILILGYLRPYAVPLRAQTQAKQITIGRIVIDGASRFSETQIVTASGLKAGQAADDSILAAAADRLSQTGAFSEVGYRYETQNAKMTVTFHIVEETKTMACTFDNFVWFTPEDVQRAVSAEVPLYDGRVPVDGSLPQAVATALEHLLTQHHIAAGVTYIPAGKLGSSPTEYRYSAKGDLPPITSVEYVGGPLDQTYFSIATQRLLGHPFSSAFARSLAENDLNVTYQNHGYLRAHFAEAKPIFSPGTNANDPGNARVVFTVVPGMQYAWRGADWNGNRTYSAAELDQSLGMKAGDIAAADKIAAGVDAVHEVYAKKGYIAANLSSDQLFDDEARQVRYSFKVQEGSQYHMGTFTASGVDPQVAERIRKAWRLKAGDVYDASYMREFGRKDLPGAIAGSPAASPAAHRSFSMRPNPNTLTVDVTFSLN